MIEFNNFSFKLNFAQFFFLFVKFMLTYFQSVHKCAVIQWFLWKFLASFLVSTMSSYLAFGHSFDWSYHLSSYRDGDIFILFSRHFGTFKPSPFPFPWARYSFCSLFWFSGMVPFLFWSFEFELCHGHFGWSMSLVVARNVCFCSEVTFQTNEGQIPPSLIPIELTFLVSTTPTMVFNILTPCKLL